MNIIKALAQNGCEKILSVHNEEVGLHAIIAVHSTARGPALGGCRLWPYECEEDALFDVVRLSRMMTLKNAAAGLPFGGGKAVIIADPSQKTEAMLTAFAEAVNTLEGSYITTEDVNITCRDTLTMSKTTKYVCGLPDLGGDLSPFTAFGVWQGIKAAAKVAFGTDSLRGRTIAVQGLGKVGYTLCRFLHAEGAKLYVSNLQNRQRLEQAVEEFDAEPVDPDQIPAQICDILAPCALGGVVNPDSLPWFECRIIAGSANNVIHSEACGRELKERGILYVPDFIINAGGVINAAGEAEGCYNKEETLKKIYNIYNTVQQILLESQTTGKPEGIIAEEYALRCIPEK